MLSLWRIHKWLRFDKVLHTVFIESDEQGHTTSLLLSMSYALQPVYVTSAVAFSQMYLAHIEPTLFWLGSFVTCTYFAECFFRWCHAATSIVAEVSPQCVLIASSFCQMYLVHFVVCIHSRWLVHPAERPKPL